MNDVGYNQDKLGARAFTSFSVWLAVLAWTFFYCEGAGFGAAIYRNVCARGLDQQPCPLVYQFLFPPQVSLSTFALYVASFWFNGLYDAGLMVAFFLAVVLTLTASQLKRATVERVFSWGIILAGCGIACAAGYFYELHQTLSTGIAHVPLL